MVALAVMAWRWMQNAIWELHPRWQLTPAGRAWAAHWLGVRDWLRGFPTFADLPPAAITVWDRYLAYGATLDATPSTSGTINLGYDWKHRLWSSYGGQWRRVTVQTKTWAAIRLALLQPRALIPELVLAFYWCLVGPFFLAIFPFGSVVYRAVRLLPNPFALFPVVALPVAGYLVVRRLVDKVRPVRVVGVVLHVRYVGQRFSPRSAPRPGAGHRRRYR